VFIFLMLFKLFENARSVDHLACVAGPMGLGRRGLGWDWGGEPGYAGY
jgi:hypothetical protein